MFVLNIAGYDAKCDYAIETMVVSLEILNHEMRVWPEIFKEMNEWLKTAQQYDIFQDECSNITIVKL